MSKAVDYFVGPSEQDSRRDVEQVKDNLTQNRGDPLPGQTPEVTNQAIRESQKEARTTPVNTMGSEKKEGIAVGQGHPDLQKQSLADRVGSVTPEKQTDVENSVSLGKDDLSELNQIRSEMRGIESDGKQLDQNDLFQHRETANNKVQELSTEVKQASVGIGEQMQQAGVQQESEAVVSSPAVEQFADQSQRDREPEQTMEREPGE